MAVPRSIIASLLAPVIALAPLLFLGVWELGQPVRIIDGEPDDAPTRSLGLLIMASPVIYVVMAIAAFAVGSLFRRCGLQSLKSFLSASVALVLLLSVPIGIVTSNPHVYGVQDSFIAIAAFAATLLLCVVPGAVCWWYMTRGDA